MAKVATKSLAEDFSSVTITFANEQSITVNVEDFPEEIVAHLAAHGLSQKLGDSFAGLGDDLDKAVEAVNRVITELAEGNWTTRTPGSGGPRLTQLVEALARVSGRSVDECMSVVDNMSDDAKKALRANAQIKKAAAEIKLEKLEQAQAEKPETEVDFTKMFDAA